MSHDYKIELSQQAAKFVKKSKEPVRTQILNALQLLAHSPIQGKPLVGPLSGKYSWRVGNYRIIYSLVKDRLIVFVIDIGHRKNIYD